MIIHSLLHLDSILNKTIKKRIKMKKQIILAILIVSLMNGCVLKRIFGGKGHGGGKHNSSVVRTR